MAKRPNKYGSGSLPKPNVNVPNAGITHFTEADIRGLVCNPIYAGIHPYPQITPDAIWISAAEKVIRDEGVRQFLVNMLHCLRVTYKDTADMQMIQEAAETLWTKTLPSEDGHYWYWKEGTNSDDVFPVFVSPDVEGKFIVESLLIPDNYDLIDVWWRPMVFPSSPLSR